VVKSSAWRSRFFWQIYIGFVGLILVTIVIAGVLLAQQVEDDTLAEARETLRRNALFLKEVAVPHLKNIDALSIEGRVQEVGRQLGVRLTVIDADGRVVADSLRDVKEGSDLANRPEVLAAREHGVGTSARYSDLIDGEMMYHALVVEEDGVVLGFARTALPRAVLEEQMSSLRSRAITGVVIAGFVALVFTFFFTRRVTHPLLSLSSVVQSIARGDYKDRVDSSARDEVGELSRSFDVMAEQLRTRIDSISQEENKVVTILAHMVEGVVAVDRQGRILHINESAARILRVRQEAHEGRHLYEVTCVQDVGELLRETLRDGRERREEVRVIQNTGQRVIEAHCSPLRDGAGGLVGGVLVLHDITDLRRLEMVRRDFVANVSHELKTPVTAIRGLVETMLDTDDMDPGTRTRFLEKVENQSQRMSNLVSDLLTLSRVESRRGIHLDRERFDLRERVLDSERRALVVADEKGIRLESDITTDPIDVFGDEEGLQKIVDNLLDNAIKYTPQGGSVLLQVAVEGSVASILVEDSGIGIDEEDQERIFERFYRVDKARSRELGGTGLGLSIVKHLVAAMGGTIRLDSKLGEGSRFRVEFAVAAEESSNAGG
jgi:two-component system phosphate regulon sensor histidine kinase PhoR